MAAPGDQPPPQPQVTPAPKESRDLGQETPPSELLDEKQPTSADDERSSTDGSHPGEEDVEEIDGDYGSYRDHAFSDPQVAEYWRRVYEEAKYEGRHRFDPSFTWSASEEKRVRRKVKTPSLQRGSSRGAAFADRGRSTGAS